MCRQLYARSRKNPFSIEKYLKPFSQMCSNSSEYQGHGWGIAWLDSKGKWQSQHWINPIWESDLSGFGETKAILVHARSAFQDRDIDIVHNMPFIENGFLYVFNGELQGVRMRMPGRNGAHRIFSMIQQKAEVLPVQDALKNTIGILERRTQYIRAMNILLVQGDEVHVHCQFSENPDYFTMHKMESDDFLAICSKELPGLGDWLRSPNKFTGVFK